MATIVTSDVVLEDIDMGYAAIKRNLARAGGVRIETGLFGREAQKGVWLEFGTRSAGAGPESGIGPVEEGPTRTKPRPWLSVAADTEQNKIASSMADAVDDVALGADAKTSFEAVGEESAKLTKAVLGTSRVGGPALADSTMARKGHGRKGVDSGDMQAAVKSKVTVRR